MNRSNESSEGKASRFAHYGDEPEEGGVYSTRGKAGAPGPGEKLLDISEMARTIGMYYTHQFRIPPAPDVDVTSEFPAVAPVIGEVTLTNTGDALLLRGEAKTTLRLECARCLEPVDVKVETELAEEFPLVAERNHHNQEEVQVVDEDAPAAVISGNILDLGDLLRQNLMLAAPLQPRCEQECTVPGLITEEELEAARAAQAEATVNADNPLRRLAELLKEKDE